MDHTLCELNEIENPGARGFEIGDQPVVIVRKDESVQAFINSCPHRGIRLEWQPDQFLDYAKQYIQCSTHGALFTLDKGLCVVGPCNGKSLQALDCRIEDGKVVVTHVA